MTTLQVRQPAGAPTGGQFATSARGEGAVTLAPPAVGALGIEPGDSMMLSAFEAGTDILDTVEIVHEDEGGYRADGTVDVNFIDGYRHIAGVPSHEPLDLDHDEHEAAVAWLNDHAPVLEAFLTERYGAELEQGPDEWEHQRMVFSVPLDPAEDTTETVAAKLENGTRAVQLYNESDAGTFGSPYLWAEAKRHLDVWNADVETAQRGYLTAVMEDAGMQHGQAVDRADVLPAAQLEERAGNVRRFMRDNHALLQQAKAAHRQQHGTEQDPFWLGRDVSLALHNPPETPHGRLAFAALPTALQAQLQRAARRYGPS